MGAFTMRTQSSTVAEAILQQLRLLGVDTIYGVCGDAILELLDALSKQDQIQFIETRHESAAGFMASAYAKLTGKIGVCVATSGPGAANLLNGIGDAYGDHVPVLAITGQVPTDKIGTHSKQYVDQQRLMEPLAAYSALVASPESVLPLLHRAVTTAIKNQTVSHLSIPKDLFTQLQSADILSSRTNLYYNYPSDFSQISTALEFILECKRPMILIGKGAKSAGTEISRLAEKLGAGVIYSLGAKGVIPEQMDLIIGGIGEGGSEEAECLMKECDGLLVIGAMWYPKDFLSPSIPILQIERKSDHIQWDKNVQTALVGDTGSIVQSLLERLGNHTSNPNWLQRLQDARANWLKRKEQEGNDHSLPIAPAAVMRQLGDAIDPRAIITLDTGDHTVWFNRSFSSKEQEVVFSGTWRTLGFALPAANAAQLLHPSRQVVAIAGDGGFAMSMAELSTTVHYQLPIKIILFNNSSFGMEKNKMEHMGYQPFATKLTNPQFYKLAQSFGMDGFRVEQPDQLKNALFNLMQCKGPALLEIISSTAATPLS